ncbi:hypothetical protein [Nitrobacter sp.]|uniref:hypothetical protein n=1 Tax=Nitrobacter sp. TaxID=29420 RepID=UPI00399D6912
MGELGSRLVIHDNPPEMAVCLLPGTELAFDDNVRYDRAFHLRLFGTRIFGKAQVDCKVASFRQVDTNDPYVQHDALEFPDGKILKINKLAPGQTATVLQLPVAIPHNDNDHEQFEARAAACRAPLVLHRASVGSGIASILIPSESTVMLLDTLRGSAVRFFAALAQAFRRLTASRRPDLEAASLADVDAGVETGALATTRPQKLAEKTQETKVGSAA